MWNDFEHRVWKKIKTHDLDQKKLILTISGGLDSMALLSVISNLNIKNIVVLHFHHGDSKNKDYRDQALIVVQKYYWHPYNKKGAATNWFVFLRINYTNKMVWCKML